MIVRQSQFPKSEGKMVVSVAWCKPLREMCLYTRLGGKMDA